MPDYESKFVSIEAAERPQRGWVGSGFYKGVLLVLLEARAKPPLSHGPSYGKLNF